VTPQDADAARVECHDPYFPRFETDHVVDTASHLISCLIGKGYRENAVGIHTAYIDQVRNAVNEDPGLTGTGPGKDKDRTFRCEDRLLLLFI
jgi:hypothetical protein